MMRSPAVLVPGGRTCLAAQPKRLCGTSPVLMCARHHSARRSPGFNKALTTGRPQRVPFVCLAAAASGSNFIERSVKAELGVQSAQLEPGLREAVEVAVRDSRYRAVVGEVAARAGVKLEEAETALKALAYDSGAVLEVSAWAMHSHTHHCVPHACAHHASQPFVVTGTYDGAC